MNSSPINYRIDASDRIVAVNAAWSEFAAANAGQDSLPERVVGAELWSFINDDTINELYRRMVARARAGHTMRFRYRCDAPAERRHFEMKITAGVRSEVEFSSLMVSCEPRPAVGWLDRHAARGDDLVRMCGWCGRVALGDGQWVEIELAIEQHGAFQNLTPPRISHGICPECFQRMVRLLPPEVPANT